MRPSVAPAIASRLRAWWRWSLPSAWLRRRLAGPNIQIGARVLFKGTPRIAVHPDARLVIGDDVTINSDNDDYHVNLYAPCKLMADRPGAVIEIGPRTRLHGSCVHAFERITIGANCLIAANCQIIDGNGHDLSFDDVDRRIHTRGSSKPVVIEDAVWLGTGVVVLPGVRIGRGSVVSANSVVTRNIPPMSIAMGNPAVVVRARASDEGGAPVP